MTALSLSASNVGDAPGGPSGRLPTGEVGASTDRDAVLACLGSGSPDPQSNHRLERRSVPRYRFLQTALVRFVEKPSFQPFAGFIHDLSLRGIGLVADRHHEPGTALAVELRSRTKDVSWVRLARVRHARPLPEGYWVLGCQLACPLPEEGFRLLCHEDQAGPARAGVVTLTARRILRFLFPGSALP